VGRDVSDDCQVLAPQLARVIPFFAHPPEVRKIIYTTNAVESLNHLLRKVTKGRGSFPNDEAVFKLLYLALRAQPLCHHP
jgi:transposase-like protein